MIIVKLGGSLARTDAHRLWLSSLAWAGGRAVIVPGGGVFADAVRAAQAPLGYGDAAAHDMALMAMAQLARAFVDAAPGLTYADRLDSLGGPYGPARRPTPVFAAWPALRDAPDLPCGWHVTSDSIALWLAAHLGAAALVLVKSVAPPPGDAAALARDGLLDPAFPALAARFAGRILIAGPDAPPDPLAHPLAHWPGRLLTPEPAHV